MLRRTSIRRQLSRAFRSACFVSLGILLSISLNTLVLAPSIAQTTPNEIPNNSSIEYDSPEQDPDDPGTERSSQVSNTVIYPLRAVLGVSDFGLGLVKSANKSAVEPGDVVIYTLLVSNNNIPGEVNNANATVDLEIEDAFPLGVQYVASSATAAIGNTTLNFDVDASSRRLFLDNFSQQLLAGQQMTIRYAATVSPDAIRGDGINRAEAIDSELGRATDQFQLTIGSGILSDCGTIVGRVFVDSNFDGHQQPGEAGIPNAVIFMETGNRIITDPNGLFSMANVFSGNRVGALDLSSLNGYTLAPNLFRVEENSQSRLVRLEPGGLARMNFAVTPTFGEGEK